MYVKPYKLQISGNFGNFWQFFLQGGEAVLDSKMIKCNNRFALADIRKQQKAKEEEAVLNDIGNASNGC